MFAPRNLACLFSALLLASAGAVQSAARTQTSAASNSKQDSNEQRPEATPRTSRLLEFETLMKHFACGHSQAGTYVINDADAWQELWKATMSNTFPIPPAPLIDFSRHTVVAVYQGDQPSSGYDIAIQKAVRTHKKIKVTVREVLPEDGCPVMLVITQPFHIVVTDTRFDLAQVDFKIKTHVIHCDK